MSDDPKAVLVDDLENEHKDKIASHIQAATGQPHSPAQVTPATVQPPVVQVDPNSISREEASRDESELEDMLRGMQGKPRTGRAADFLKEKMKWLSKKNKGAPVTLK